MGGQQYALHSRIMFVPPIKPVRSPTYPLNPMNGNISVADQKYQNNLHEYHPVKKLNSALKKITVTDIDDQCIKEKKCMVMRYSKNL